MALLTTTVGWFPKPPALRRARWLHAEQQLDAQGLRDAERAATAEAFELQRKLGLDLLVDGQMDRGDPVAAFAEGLDGVERGGLVRCVGNRFYRRPLIVGDVAWRGPTTVDHWKMAREILGDAPRAILTGPYTLMDWSFDEHYDSREACCRAMVAAVRAEVEALCEAGATEIEIDEPAISARPEEMPLAADALREVTAPLAGRARTWTHLCYGDLLPVIGEVLALPVDGLLLELSHTDEALVEALAALPADKLLGAGVIDVHDPRVETVDTVRARAERIAKVVDPSRLWLVPDAGLRTLAPHAVEAKLRNLVAAAAQL